VRSTRLIAAPTGRPSQLFAVLVSATGSAWFRWMVQLTQQNRHAAEDLCQECVHEVGRLAGPCPFSAGE